MIQELKYYKPTLGQSWWLVLLILVGSLVGGGIALFWSSVPQSLSYFIMMLVPLLWCVMKGRLAEQAGVRPLAIHAPHYGKLPAWVFFVLAGIALIAVSFLVEPLANLIPMPDSIKAIFEKAFVESTLWDMVVSTCILAPLLEELLCRGIMLRGMLARRKAPWKAIVWSALIFAVMHMNPWQSIPAFLIGLLLGWVYYRTHSLWATIFLHCLNNSISTVISRVWADLPIDAGLKDVLPETTYWIVYVAAALLLAITLVILNEKTVSPQVQAPVDA